MRDILFAIDELDLNKGGYAVDSDMFSLEVLLEKSRTLADSKDEGGHHAES